MTPPGLRSGAVSSVAAIQAASPRIPAEAHLPDGSVTMPHLRVVVGLAFALLVVGPVRAEWHFNRIATFATPRNNGDRAAAASSAEIIAASGDGRTLIYTDSPLGAVGRIDISDPRRPRPLGITDVGGEPTSVTVIGGMAYVAVNTSRSFTAPSGKLVAIDLASGAPQASCELGGQPDSTAHDASGTFIAVAIENERDEDAGNGRVPQLPGGWVVKVPLVDGLPRCDALRRIDITGLADIAPEDPEPEFVDVNGRGEIVVTLQENNHLVVIGADDTIIAHFPAGAVDLEGIDTEDDGALRFDGTQQGRLREPDSVQWLDDDHFVTANEGDMDGGSRSFTVFAKDGRVVFESHASLETPIIQAGHYPDKRSDAKGVEPEGLEVGSFGGTPYAFVLTERASTVSVYDVTDPARPVFKQLLPAGVSPEGAIAIPQRNLLVVSSEEDFGADGGVRAHVTIYEYQDAPAAYPHLTSAGLDPLVGWGAISGLVAGEDGTIHAVSDGFYKAQPTIFAIDTTQRPARIVAALPITRQGKPARTLDLEGITHDGRGGFWVASEGRTDRDIPHALCRVAADGGIVEEIPLPPELAQHETRYGFEGITRVGDRLWIAVQRGWRDDPEGQVKLLAYDLDTLTWGAVRYQLDTPTAGWQGLSEIVAHGDALYVIERDNQGGSAAVHKKIYRIPAAEMVPAPLGGPLPVVSKHLAHDLVADLAAEGGIVPEKVEGLAIFADGTAWVATDNDGVDDHSGETFFRPIGRL